ncbi:tyrosyl-DNA phosphodiesterase 2-like isoform X2 [Actinia tenebrosa]|nr:tyrosyl-DNA phosphodiesterase 2-like isoform X2 [Actinia tenebrosa]
MDENSGTASHPILVDSSPISKSMGVSSVRVDGEQNAKDDNLILLTWNIDGLSEKQLVERTRYVCELINTRRPDVVFLQEVIDDTLLVFHQRCKGYTTVCGKRASGYFNAIMLKDQTVKPAGPLEELYFSRSTMGRHLLMQPAIFNQQIKVVLMTSHLESTANCKQERKRQLEIVFNKMLSQNPECTVIFGGDTNLRDVEVGQVGIPNEISDDTKFTWDISVNDNQDWQFPNKPKLRFDRVYARPGQNENCLEPLEFSLVGKQRLASGVYPSDHWGIWCKFVKKTAEKH